MRVRARSVELSIVALAVLACSGCPGILPGSATDTTAPAPCSSDEDCPQEIACIFPNGEDQQGICDVEETNVSSTAPAPCMADGDCPVGIACIFLDGEEGTGICNVDETEAPG